MVLKMSLSVGLNIYLGFLFFDSSKESQFSHISRVSKTIKNLKFELFCTDMLYGFKIVLL